MELNGRALGGRGNESVYALFEAAASARAERPALLVAGKVLFTYGEMVVETGRAAAWLRSIGIGQGDRALVQVHKSPAAVILYLACLRAGVVFIPLNTAYQESELSYFAADAEPALLVSSPGLPAERVAFGGARASISGALEAAPWAPLEDRLATVQATRDDPAAIRPGQPGDQVDQRRLAGSRAAEQGGQSRPGLERRLQGEGAAPKLYVDLNAHAIRPRWHGRRRCASAPATERAR